MVNVRVNHLQVQRYKKNLLANTRSSIHHLSMIQRHPGKICKENNNIKLENSTESWKIMNIHLTY